MPVDKEKAKKIREGYEEATAGGKDDKKGEGLAAKMLRGVKSAAEALGLSDDESEKKKKKK